MNSGGATNALSHFECDPFDLLGNAPYVNLQKSFPEKGEKSRREQQILSCRKCADFDDNTMENQEELPKCRLDFESISLRPLRYVCLFNFVAWNFPQGVISSQSRYDRFDTSAYSGAFVGKASISIPEMPRGVNVSAGQIRQNDAAKSKKTAHSSRAMDASAGRQKGYSLPSSSRSRTSKRLLQRRVYSCSISGVGCAISGIITVTAPAA